MAAKVWEWSVLNGRCWAQVVHAGGAGFDAHGLSTRKSISRPRYLINSVTRSSVYDEGLDVELLRNTLVGCLVLAVVVVVEVAGAGKRTRESYEGDSKRYAALAVTVREPSTRSWHPPIARISTA